MRFKIFQRLYWRTDAGGYFNWTSSERSIIIHFGPIMIWIYK